VVLQRTSFRMKRQIRELRRKDYSISKIAECLGICRKTVRKVLDSDVAKAKLVDPSSEGEFSAVEMIFTWLNSKKYSGPWLLHA